jgi:hypothetical protein
MRRPAVTSGRGVVIAAATGTMNIVGRMVTNTMVGKPAQAPVWGGQDGPVTIGR